MPKRKRTHTEESKDEDPAKRRKKGLHYDAIGLCQELYDTVRNHKLEDGKLLCESFIRAPKRRNSADYYEVVTNPIDMLKIQQKIKTDEYDDIDQMTTDIELMINNAKSYYKKTNQEYKDACLLWETYIDLKNQLLLNSTGGCHLKQEPDDGLSGDNLVHGRGRGPGVRKSHSFVKGASINIKNLRISSPDPFHEEENPYEDLFAAVMTASDSDGHVLSSLFQLIPSRRKYPEYYKVIQEPMDLKMIATKIQNKEYKSLNDLEHDLLQIVKNAKTFNEPGSMIYKDSITLRKIITSKKIEIEHGKIIPSKTSERIRAKRLAGGQNMSSITAALQYESDGEESNAPMIMEDSEVGDEEDAVDPDDSDNPQWQLYDSVRNYQNYQGYALSEPFLRLPSKRMYPDYYKETKNPISLCNIRCRIKTGSYPSVADLVDDLNLMFDNAKHYNRADSRIYKDAAKLQKIMQVKARDLMNLEKDSDSDDKSAEDRMARRRVGAKKSTPCSEEKRRPGRPCLDPDMHLKKRMRYLYKTLVDYLDDNNRPLITMFMEKPLRKDYPDYYQIISDPIDMKTIDFNIKNDKYSTAEALIADFKLMFKNCRHYNEEASQIYHDADTLEQVLTTKVREIEGPKSKLLFRRKKLSIQLLQKLKTLYDTVKEYADPKGRKLSLIFMKLPTKTDYPDYYEVIKRPLDLTRIQMKLHGGQYDSLEELLADFVLMFDNACKYNEPDSQIYKDALTLQRIALQTKVELGESEEGIPDVRALVQEMLTSLFVSVYNHQDEEGRCYSDSLVELSESAETLIGQKMLNLDCIKRNLDKGRYRRLDRFQEDIFEVFEKARRMSRTDSQAFEDSIELQSYFIKVRDELCRNGEVLQSPSLNHTERHLQLSVDKTRKEKIPRENREDEREKEQDSNKYEKEQRASQHNSESVQYKEHIYHIGDYVYIEPREKGLEPHIIHIEKLWKDDQGEQWLYGCWFYRPNETFHLATRKFLEKEVFKSDNFNSTLMNQVLGKCYVMFVKDYFKYKPEGFYDKDVYVCESRYSAKAKAFKKIKIWPVTSNNLVQFIPRDQLLTPVRVPSVFKEKAERVKEETVDLDEFDCKIVEKQKHNVELDVPGKDKEDGCYYEQYNLPSGAYKLGDYVYVRSENGKKLIARIDKMWVNKSGGQFHGPWVVMPSEVPHPPTRLFYKQEVFLSSIEDTNPLLSITGKCSVLETKEYVKCRPTEVPEMDVFVCESRYMEAERQVRKLLKGLRKFTYSHKVIPDEIYFFRKTITLPKTEIVASPSMQTSKLKHHVIPDPSPLLPKVLSDLEMEDSNDGGAPSVGSSDTPAANNAPSTTSSSKKKPLRRLVTGYILFAGEVRKSFIVQNPDSSFGEISRIVGTEWRNLPQIQKTDYEERALKMNEETAAKEVAKEAAAEMIPQSPKPENTLYECQWDGCDYQFEDQQELADHLIQDPTGHVQRSYQHVLKRESDGVEQPKSEFQCMWHNCSRIRKNIPPFPNIQRLIRHCREVHIKASGKVVNPTDRGKNFFPSRNPNQAANRPGTPGNQSLDGSGFPTVGYSPMLLQPGLHPSHPGSSNPYLPPGMFGGTPVQGTRPVDPMFVAPPPKPQRLLHSEAYIRYIESLHCETKMVSNWDSHLKATPENTPLGDSGRLPVHWLGNGVGNHGNVVNALWALRDFMMKDALNLANVC